MQNEHESTDIIRIDHLNKTFGDVKAVNDLSFQEKAQQSQFSADSYRRTAERYRSKESITKERANRQSG